VAEVEPGRVLVKLPFASRQLRPGGRDLGADLDGAGRHGGLRLILAHIGEVAMAVTTSLNIHFLRGCKPGDLLAEEPCSSWAAASRRPMS
jgi:acyl-coenzyme A thioesterase PaaI-like protein